MKNIHATVFLLLLHFSIIAQKEDIEILTRISDDRIEFYAANNLDVQQELTLKITGVNLEGDAGPVTQLVPSKDTIYMTVFKKEPGKRWTYNYKIDYRPLPSEEELKSQDEALKQMTLNKLSVLDDGIVLFYKDGCPRCAYATNYMLDRNMKFKIFDVTNNEEHNKLMWDLIRLEKPELNNVQLPVMLVDGNISYNIEDIKEFFRKLYRARKD